MVAANGVPVPRSAALACCLVAGSQIPASSAVAGGQGGGLRPVSAAAATPAVARTPVTATAASTRRRVRSRLRVSSARSASIDANRSPGSIASPRITTSQSQRG